MAETRYQYDNAADVRRRSGAGQTKKKRKPGAYRRTRSRTLLFSLVILALAGGAVALYTVLFANRQETVAMTDTSIPAASTYVNTGDGLLYQSEGKIHFYHLTDARKNYTYGIADAAVRMAGSSSITVVYNDTSLQILGRDTPLTFSGTIEEVQCGKGYLAVLVSANGVESVSILTADGVKAGELTADDQYIVDFGFYQTSDEMLWLETLNIAAGSPTTTIMTYDIAKKMTTGRMQVQNQLLDELYITSDSLFAAGTNQIIRYTHDNKEVYRQMVYGYRVIDYTDAGTPTFLMTPRGGDMHSVKLITLNESDTSGLVETYLQLPTEGVAAFLMNGKLVVVSRENVFTYTLKGKLSATAVLELPADSAVKLSESVLLLASGGVYYSAKIQ